MPVLATTGWVSTSNDRPVISRSLRSISPPNAIPPRPTNVARAKTLRRIRLMAKSSVPRFRGGKRVDFAQLAREACQTRFNSLCARLNEHGLGRRSFVADPDHGIVRNQRLS